MGFLVVSKLCWGAATLEDILDGSVVNGKGVLRDSLILDNKSFLTRPLAKKVLRIVIEVACET